MEQDIRKLVQTLRPEIDAALAAIAKKHGLEELRAGHCSYSVAGSFTFKLEGVVGGGLGKDAERYNTEAKWLALPPLGSKMTIGGEIYTTAGLRAGGKVILDRASDGKSYLFKQSDIQRLALKQGLVKPSQPVQVQEGKVF